MTFYVACWERHYKAIILLKYFGLAMYNIKSSTLKFCLCLWKYNGAVVVYIGKLSGVAQQQDNCYRCHNQVF